MSALKAAGLEPESFISVNPHLSSSRSQLSSPYWTIFHYLFPHRGLDPAAAKQQRQNSRLHPGLSFWSPHPHLQVLMEICENVHSFQLKKKFFFASSHQTIRNSHISSSCPLGFSLKTHPCTQNIFS